LIRDQAEIAVASNGERLQPVYALLPVSLAASVRGFLSAGERKIDRWYASHRIAVADFSDRAEGFANVNSPEDSALLERALDP
jgi:molybdopterin-guanine dinucleotide biosynthesis protein A